jgi:Zn-dependent peptidase ImmA (M78 family)
MLSAAIHLSNKSQGCSVSILDLIQDFQYYILQQCAKRAHEWPLTHDFIERITTSLVENASPRTDWIDIQLIAHNMNVDVSFARTRLAGHGRIIPKNDGFVAMIAGNPGDVRARFTLAHELGHILFYDLERVPARRLFAHLPDSNEYRREEGLCDKFAGTLLLPKSFFPVEITDSISMKEILDGASLRKVSAEVMVRRILHDFHWLRKCGFYLIIIRGNAAVKVQRFVGSEVRGKGISGPELLRRISNAGSCDLPERVSLVLGTGADIWCRDSSIWVKI